jgi:hypothetical protein
LDKYSAKAAVEKTLICLSRFRVGDIADISIALSRTKPAVNRLFQEGIKAAKAAVEQGDANYESVAKVLCRDIRVLLEQIVEADLINGVVRRYNPEVQTKGKIHALAKITVNDCEFIDDLMTKYSRHEHSQSEESPVELPKPEDFEKDLKSIAAFIDAVQNRSK